MILYRISAAKYAHSLSASGIENRWNHKGQFVIYTASSRSLAVLELTVHRASIHTGTSFRMMCIHVNEDIISSESITAKDLGDGWSSFSQKHFTQQIGANWYRSRKSCILKVPSAIVPQEYNYIINTSHPQFLDGVAIDSVEEFSWDRRLIK